MEASYIPILVCSTCIDIIRENNSSIPVYIFNRSCAISYIIKCFANLLSAMCNGEKTPEGKMYMASKVTKCEKIEEKLKCKCTGLAHISFPWLAT